MVFNADQRHEGRRCLPKGTRDRNQLVLKHMGLAHCVATRQQQRGPEEHDDLLQEARLGLIQGMDNWDPSRGFRPSSYLMSRANGQVLHYRRDRSRMVRIPWRLQDLYVSGQRLQQERMQKGLPLLDDSSIAERLRVTLQRWLDATAAEVSKKIMPIGNLDLETTPCCPKPDAQTEWLQGVLHLLAPQQQTLLKQHLIEGVGLRDLAQCHQLSQRRLKQMLQNGIRCLRLLAIQDGLLVPPRPLPSPLPEAFAAH